MGGIGDCRSCRLVETNSVVTLHVLGSSGVRAGASASHLSSRSSLHSSLYLM